MINFYNVNDWALSNVIWQNDERLKPDTLAGNRPPYTFEPSAGANNFSSGTFAYLTDVSPGSYGTLHPLALFDVDGIHDQYEVMSFAAQAQCLALGATDSLTPALGITSVDLRAIAWGGDDKDVYHNHFKDHVWHSGEFHFSNDIQNNYWNQVMKKFQLKTNQ